MVGPAGYRTTGYWWDRDEVHVGEEVLLSPAGNRLAWSDTMLRVHDIRAGKTRSYHLPYLGLYSTGSDGNGPSSLPLAWSPDGRSIAIAQLKLVWYAVPGGANADVHWMELAVLDLDTGEYRGITTASGKFTSGFAVAFSPDGQRIAFQSGDQLSVVDLNGAVKSTTTLPKGALLAGKAAWTPNGVGIAIAVPTKCCDRAADDWIVRLANPETGSLAAGSPFPIVRHAVAIRVVGWSGPTEPVAVVFHPEPVTYRSDWPGERTRFGLVRRADVMALRADTEAPRLLVTVPEQVLALDIAEQAVATGLIVPAPQLPPFFPSWVLVGGMLSGPALLVGCVVVGIHLMRRRAGGRSDTDIALQT